MDYTLNDCHNNKLLSSVENNGLHKDVETKNYPPVSLYDNPKPSTSGLQNNIVEYSSGSDLDLNLNVSFLQEHSIGKYYATGFYTFSSANEDPKEKGEFTPEKQIIRTKTKSQLKSSDKVTSS